jgi:tellurite resistance protein TerC
LSGSALLSAPFALLGIAAQETVAQGSGTAATPAVVDWRLWGMFGAVILAVMVLDLFVLNRKHREVKLREAAITGGCFVALAVAFCAFVWWQVGAQPAQEFLAGYVVELSLSFDNLFVFLLLFNFFQVERQHQHRVLFWGILGALVLRAIFILVDAALL